VTEDELKCLFSSRLQHLLQQNEMKQNDLAKILSVSESTVGKWILMKAMPRMGIIQKLSEYFHVSMKYFLEKDSPDPLPIIKKFELTDQEQEMIRKYRELSPAGKATVDAVIDVQYKASHPVAKKETS
jgi:transcriptional regulator with XRE-family HTH domain